MSAPAQVHYGSQAQPGLHTQLRVLVALLNAQPETALHLKHCSVSACIRAEGKRWPLATTRTGPESWPPAAAGLGMGLSFLSPGGGHHAENAKSGGGVNVKNIT